MSKILITGGAGFIGSHVADALIACGHTIVIIDNFSIGKKENINASARVYSCDITNVEAGDIIQKEKPDAIIHLAAQIDVRKSVADPVADANINILGSINIIENARIAQVKKIIFASTGGAIYGDTQNIPTQEDEPRNPISPYGVAKLAIEHYLYYYSKVFEMKYVILRFANVYGPRQNSRGEAGVVAIFCDKILSGQTPVIFGDGKNTRDFVFVEDVAQANVAALASDATGYYNVGTSVETDVNKLSEYIASAFGYRGEYTYEEAKSGEQRRSCLDFSKIKKNLGWEPKTSLKEGIEKTAQWFRKKT